MWTKGHDALPQARASPSGSAFKVGSDQNNVSSINVTSRTVTVTAAFYNLQQKLDQRRCCVSEGEVFSKTLM